MFIEYNGERVKVLLQGDSGAWVISYDSYQMPYYHVEHQIPASTVCIRHRCKLKEIVSAENA